MLNKIENLFKLREQLHKCPEVAYNEYGTQKILLNFINNHVSEPRFKVLTPMDSSIVVEYYGHGKEDVFILFRADMDALSIEECRDNPVVSEKQGVMHACGHDIHMTVLAGLIAETADRLPEKNIIFVFQPAEEGAGGAKKNDG